VITVIRPSLVPAPSPAEIVAHVGGGGPEF
jgi:hypothetical protein